MKKLSILTFLALFAATLTHQGSAWAQDPEDTKADNWGQVPTVTSKWTHITESSTTGYELKDAYYYVTEDLTFTNTISGDGQGSGMYVQAGRTVTLYIPAGVTLTAIGANAYETTGAGAGILLPSGSTLNVVGSGKLIAKGGNAANGKDGYRGTNGELDEESVETWFIGAKIICGAGGHGGDGAAGPVGNESYKEWTGGDLAGVTGNVGGTGGNAEAMGTLNIQSSIITDIVGGAAGSGGASGWPGNVSTTGGEIEFSGVEFVNGIPIPTFDITEMQAVAGGGGGGAGGGSAEAIGTGGAGGGGGASGAAGSACAHDSWTNDYWGSVGAGGGTGGIGTNGNNGADGYTCWFKGDDNIFDDEENHKPGGIGGAAGTASIDMASSVGVAVAPKYKVSYYTVGASLSKNEEEYEVGNDTEITLPTITSTDGNNYKWILSIYGNTIGTTSSHCGGPNGYVYEPGATVDLSNIYGDIEFCAIYIGCTIDCASTTEQWWTLGWASYAAGKYAVVNLKNRKLYKDGYWNTLTLPFSLSAEKLATTCLAGADIRKFESASWDGTNKALTLNFSNSNEGKIDAGVPYIIRWGKPETATGEVIEDPCFTNVAVTLTDQANLNDDEEYNNYEKEDNGVRFQALIGPSQLQPNDNMFVLGAKNKIYKVTKQMYVYATHAYFDCYSNDDISMARELVMDFGEGEQTTTHIDDVKTDDSRESHVEGIFNLNGQRLDAPQKGINIINGRKVVIK